MRRVFSLTIGAVLALLAALPAAAAYDTPDWNVLRTDGIVYGVGAVDGGASGVDLLLDLYEPEGNSDPAKPAMVLVHGGSFVSGSRNDMAFMADYYAARGFVVVSITYRLLGDDPVADPNFAFLGPALDDGVHSGAVDTKRAVRWLHANAATLGVDPERIFAGGFSAGAFNAMHAALSDAGVFLTDLPGQVPLPANHPDESAAVRGVLDLCGGSVTELFDPGDPPILILHTSGDGIVPVLLADLVEIRAQLHGIPYEYYLLERDGHCDFGGEVADGLALFEVISRFLDRMVFEVEPEPATMRASKLVLRDDDVLPFSERKRRLSFLSRAPGGLPAPGGDEDPTLAGASLEVYAPGGSVDDHVTLELPAAAWQAVGPAAVRGYRYRDKKALHGPVRKIRFADGRLKIVGKGEALLGLENAPLGEVVVRLRLGTGAARCAATAAGKDDTTRRFRGAAQDVAVADCPARPE